jgi:hypothetical protein
MKKKILIGSIFAVALLTLVSFSSVVGYSSFDKNPVPDLDCDGEILIIDVKPNSFITGSCEVINVGEPDSLLDWEIESYPDWGTWTFNPESGTDLEEGGIITINVEIIAPSNPNSEFIGKVTFINSNDPSDFCIVDIQVTTELNIEKISEEDCGCEDDSELEWGNPVRCLILYPIFFSVYMIFAITRGIIFDELLLTISELGKDLNCFWTQ